MHFSLTKLVALIFFSSLFAFKDSFADEPNLKKDSLAATYLSAADRYFKISQARNAFNELLKAEALYKETGNRNGEESVLIAYAKFYEDNLMWSDAERYYQKAFSIAEKDSTANDAGISFYLSNTLNRQGKYEQALTFNDYSLKHYTDADDKGKMAECYTQLADILKNLKRYDEAEKLLLKRVLPLLRSAENEFGRIACFDVLGHVYHPQKRYSEAKWFFIQANTQSRKLLDTTGIITSLINLGKVKIDIKDYDLAIRDFKEAQTLASKNNMIFLLSDAKKALSTVYQKSGNKNLSQKYMNDYQAVSGVIAGIRKNILISAKEAKSDSVKLQNRTKQPLNEPGNDKTMLYFLLGLAVLIAIAGILFLMKRKN